MAGVCISNVYFQKEETSTVFNLSQEDKHTAEREERERNKQSLMLPTTQIVNVCLFNVFDSKR